MRSLFYPLLTLIGILLVGVTLLLYRPEAWFPQAPRSLSGLSDLLRASAVEKPSPMPEPLEAKSKTSGKGPATPRQPEAIGTEGPGASIPVAGRPAPEKRYPFPIAEQIAPGTLQATLLATYGRPEARVTGADTGELHERYVYVDPATGRRTFIAMINAVVTNAQTLTQ